MKELLEFIAKSLVGYPDDVYVTEEESAGLTVLELHVNEQDMGKVIGKQGRIAKSIRALIKASASRKNKKVIVEIVQ